MEERSKIFYGSTAPRLEISTGIAAQRSCTSAVVKTPAPIYQPSTITDHPILVEAYSFAIVFKRT